MPFDAMMARPLTLKGYLASLGITPVPLEYLRRHKDEQILRNPPNPLTTGKPYLLIFALVPTLLTISAWWQGINHNMLCFLFTSIMTGACAAVLLFMTASIYSNGTGRALRGRATWIESFALSYNDETIPEPIREVVQRVRLSKPENASLIYGELIQREVVLDPYIVLDMKGERVCLGIWDGKNVIACAAMV